MKRIAGFPEARLMLVGAVVALVAYTGVAAAQPTARPSTDTTKLEQERRVSDPGRRVLHGHAL